MHARTHARTHERTYFCLNFGLIPKISHYVCANTQKSEVIFNPNILDKGRSTVLLWQWNTPETLDRRGLWSISLKSHRGMQPLTKALSNKVQDSQDLQVLLGIREIAVWWHHLSFEPLKCWPGTWFRPHRNTLERSFLPTWPGLPL